MFSLEKIKTAFERQTKAVELREGIGKGTAVTKVKVVDGLTCKIEEGNWNLTIDMGEKWGGNNMGPNSGIIGRGALGTCLAQAYILWAAKMDIPISSLEVEVHADYNTRGMCGLNEISAGYKEIRYLVKVESPAPKEEVKKMLDIADSHSPYLDIFMNPKKVLRVEEILTTKE